MSYRPLPKLKCGMKKGKTLLKIFATNFVSLFKSFNASVTMPAIVVMTPMIEFMPICPTKV